MVQEFTIGDGDEDPFGLDDEVGERGGLNGRGGEGVCVWEVNFGRL